MDKITVLLITASASILTTKEGPDRSSAPLRGRVVSRQVQEDESDAITFVASTRVRVN